MLGLTPAWSNCAFFLGALTPPLMLFSSVLTPPPDVIVFSLKVAVGSSFSSSSWTSGIMPLFRPLRSPSLPNWFIEIMLSLTKCCPGVMFCFFWGEKLWDLAVPLPRLRDSIVREGEFVELTSASRGSYLMVPWPGDIWAGSSGEASLTRDSLLMDGDSWNEALGLAEDLEGGEGDCWLYECEGGMSYLLASLGLTTTLELWDRLGEGDASSLPISTLILRKSGELNQSTNSSSLIRPSRLVSATLKDSSAIEMALRWSGGGRRREIKSSTSLSTK